MVSDTLEFDLGVDKNILVERKELPEYNRNMVLTNKREITKSYEIKIMNNRDNKNKT